MADEKTFQCGVCLRSIDPNIVTTLPRIDCFHLCCITCQEHYIDQPLVCRKCQTSPTNIKITEESEGPSWILQSVSLSLDPDSTESAPNIYQTPPQPITRHTPNAPVRPRRTNRYPCSRQLFPDLHQESNE